MKIILIAGACLLALVLAVTLLGALTPRDHHTALTRAFAAPPGELYALVRNYEAYPSWRTGIKSMRRDDSGRYVEESGHGVIPYRIVEDTAPDSGEPGRVVSRIDDPSLPFSGTWTFEIIASGAGSELRITERGSVPNPLMRFFSAYVFSHERTIRTYLDDAARKLGGA